MQTNILVIDDSETIHKVIRLAFHHLNVKIADCHSLTQATGLLESASHKPNPDIVLADASLPGEDAAQVYSALQAKLGNVPFLILIGSYDNVDESTYERTGIRNFIKKPFDSNELVEKVASILGYSISPNSVDKTEQQTTSMFSDPAITESNSAIPLPLGDVIDKKVRTPLKQGSSVASGINIPPPPLPKEKAEPDANNPPQDHAGSSAQPTPTSKSTPPPPPPAPPPQVPFHSPRSAIEVAERNSAGFSLSEDQDPLSANEKDRSYGAHSGESQEQFGEISPDGSRQFSYRDGAHEDAIDAASESLKKIKNTKNSSDLGMVEGVLTDLLRDELRAMVKSAVLEYCDQNFKGLAKEVITQEIQKLTELKSRLLIDN